MSNLIFKWAVNLKKLHWDKNLLIFRTARVQNSGIELEENCISNHVSNLGFEPS